MAPCWHEPLVYEHPRQMRGFCDMPQNYSNCCSSPFKEVAVKKKMVHTEDGQVYHHCQPSPQEPPREPNESTCQVTTIATSINVAAVDDARTNEFKPLV